MSIGEFNYQADMVAVSLLIVVIVRLIASMGRLLTRTSEKASVGGGRKQGDIIVNGKSCKRGETGESEEGVGDLVKYDKSKALPWWLPYVDNRSFTHIQKLGATADDEKSLNAVPGMSNNNGGNIGFASVSASPSDRQENPAESTSGRDGKGRETRFHLQQPPSEPANNGIVLCMQPAVTFNVEPRGEKDVEAHVTTRNKPWLSICAPPHAQINVRPRTEGDVEANETKETPEPSKTKPSICVVPHIRNNEGHSGESNLHEDVTDQTRQTDEIPVSVCAPSRAHLNTRSGVQKNGGVAGVSGEPGGSNLSVVRRYVRRKFGRREEEIGELYEQSMIPLPLEDCLCVSSICAVLREMECAHTVVFVESRVKEVRFQKAVKDGTEVRGSVEVTETVDGNSEIVFRSFTIWTGRARDVRMKAFIERKKAGDKKENKKKARRNRIELKGWFMGKWGKKHGDTRYVSPPQYYKDNEEVHVKFAEELELRFLTSIKPALEKK